MAAGDVAVEHAVVQRWSTSAPDHATAPKARSITTERTAYQRRTGGQIEGRANHPSSNTVGATAVGVPARDGEPIQNGRWVRAGTGHHVKAVFGACSVGGDAGDVDHTLAGSPVKAANADEVLFAL